MTSTIAGYAPHVGVEARPFFRGRTGYLAGAVCMALSAIMVAPLAFTVIASFKNKVEQAAVPPAYLTFHSDSR